MDQLSNISYYVSKEPNVDHIMTQLDNILHKYKDKGLMKIFKRTDDWKIPQFYGLPKIHKVPLKIRPIVPNHSWITSKVSKWLDKKLQPLVHKYNWVVKGTKDVIERLENVYLDSSNIQLVAADVESLYTNIDLSEGLRKVKTLLLQNNITCPNLIIELLEWVLYNNYFQYRGIGYKQIKGTAMGSNVAPCFANLFLIFHELQWKNKLKDKWPKVYFRFLDDIFFIWEHNEADLQDFKRVLNNTTPSLKFTFEQDGKKSTFLDLTIKIGSRFRKQAKLDYQNYEKPTNMHLYLAPDSDHPKNQKFSWITGENIRLLRNNSSKKDYTQSINLFRRHLQDRQYSKKIINQYIKYDWSDRDKLWFTPKKVHDFTVNPIVKIKNIPGRDVIAHITKKAIKRHIKTNETVKIPVKPMVIFTKNKHLLDYIRESNRSLLSREQSTRSHVTVDIPEAIGCFNSRILSPSTITNGEVLSRERQGIGTSNSTGPKRKDREIIDLTRDP
jgi:hypothetical protein